MRRDQYALFGESQEIAMEDSSRSVGLLRAVVNSDGRTRAWAMAALELAKHESMFAERTQEVVSLTGRILEQPQDVADRLTATTAGLIGAGAREELGEHIDEPRLRAWIDDAVAEGALLYAGKGCALLARRHQSRGEENAEIYEHERAAAFYVQAGALFASAKELSRLSLALHKRGDHERALLSAEQALMRLDGEPKSGRIGARLRRELLDVRRAVQQSLGVEIADFYPRYFSVGGTLVAVELDEHGSPRFLTPNADTGELQNDFRYAAEIYEGGESVRPLDRSQYRTLVIGPTTTWTRCATRADLVDGRTFVHGTSRLNLSPEDLAAFVDPPDAVLAFGFRALTPGDPFEKSFPVWMATLRRESAEVAILDRFQRVFSQLADDVSLAHLVVDLRAKAKSLDYRWIAITSALREPLLAPALKRANVRVEVTPSTGAVRIPV